MKWPRGFPRSVNQSAITRRGGFVFGGSERCVHVARDPQGLADLGGQEGVDARDAGERVEHLVLEAFHVAGGVALAAGQIAQQALAVFRQR